MKRLTCDIQLGGSTSQYISWSKRNLTREEFVANLIKRLTYRAKTVPSKFGLRCAAMVGIIYDQFDGDEYLLDIVIEAINKAAEWVK